MQNKIQLNSYSVAEVLHIIKLKYLKANLFSDCKRHSPATCVYVDNSHICACICMCLRLLLPYLHLLLPTFFR